MPSLSCRARGHDEGFRRRASLWNRSQQQDCVRRRRFCVGEVGARRAGCLRVDRARGRSCLRRCWYDAARRRGLGSELLRDHPKKSRKCLVMGCRGAITSNRSTPLRSAGRIITTDCLYSVTVLVFELKTAVSHRTRSRLATPRRTTVSTTARHGHAGAFERRGRPRTSMCDS